jgi:hypothetical protein
MYGYAVLFAAVYPPAPLLCAMLFIVELRVDGFKIFNIVQRPFPKRAASIGAWKSIVTTLSWLGAFSNALLLTYTFEVFKEVKFGDQPVPSGAAFFAFAVLIIAFKLLIAVLVPDDPQSVMTVLQRQEHLTRKLLGFSSSDARLMQGTTGALKVNMAIDDPDSGQTREPTEFGMLVGKSLKMLSRSEQYRDKERRGSRQAGVMAAGAGLASMLPP